MKKAKALWLMLISGFSAITLIPATDYNRHIPDSPMEVAAEAWQQTGQAMKLALQKAEGYAKPQ